MSTPPFTLFSLRCDPDAVLARLQDLLPNIAVTREGGVWREATGTWKRGWLKKPLKLQVKHHPDFYGDKASFAIQINGLANYVRQFPGAEDKPAIFACIRELQFSLPFIFDPDPVDEDPRLEVLAEIATMLDGFYFLPHALLDASGQFILSASGVTNPEAVIPVPASEEHGREGEGEREDDPPLQPPSPDRVARRFQILIASAVRGFVEQDSGAREEKEEFIRHVLQALHESGAWEEAEPEEKVRLETAVGSLSQDDVWSMTWQCEAAAMLAWALRLGELGPYDQMVQSWDILHSAGLGRREGRPEPAAIVKDAALRSSEELETMERRIFALHWRLRDFGLRPRTMDFRSFAETAWFGPLDTGLAIFAGTDLAINGKPIAESEPQEWQASAGILHQRHQAINWLLGRSEIYSETDTGT